jgi:hypothetical protein
MKAVLFILLIFLTACHTKKDDYLLKFTDSDGIGCGYVNTSGDTVIPLGKYYMCEIDTFRTYATVTMRKKGIVAIDRKQNILYSVFVYDNGADYIENGYFRIIKDGKIGYADSTGAVKIKPRYGCAFPFKNGKARVSINCRSTIIDKADRHTSWESDNWFYIDKTGRPIK